MDEETTLLDHFLDKLVKYMNKRYEKEKEYHAIKFCEGPPSKMCDGKKSRIEGEVNNFGTPIGKETRKMKWVVSSRSALPCIEELEDGEVVVVSDSVPKVEDVLFEYYSLSGKERGEVIRALANRDNWEKLRFTCPLVVGELAYADYIAEKVSRETGVKVTQFIVREAGFAYFFTTFDSKGMGCDKKMRMIEKALDAIDMTSKFREHANPERTEFLRREGYRPFRIKEPTEEDLFLMHLVEYMNSRPESRRGMLGAEYFIYKPPEPKPRPQIDGEVRIHKWEIRPSIWTSRLPRIIGYKEDYVLVYCEAPGNETLGIRIAERVNRETGVKISYIAEGPCEPWSDGAWFYSLLESKGMSPKEKRESIIKILDAIYIAAKIREP
ncbi:MAG: hypothetical protein QXP45_02540 [Thermoproteota archaeon]